MLDDKAKTDPAWAWAAYSPSGEAPWDARRAGHLLRRAGFGFTLAELDAAVKDGPARTVARLMAGGAGQEAFDKEMASLADVVARTQDAAALRAWGLARMLHSPHPLREKMSLFWHNHFATSNAKVQDTRLMLGQFALIHKHALGDFAALLRGMSSDPAMLVWLDGKGSRKGNPNENYARELMELFSLGLGPYTEKDIREAARAFSGWDVIDRQPRFFAANFDDGEKTVMGKSGKWKPDDIVRICLDRPECALFICGKLWRWLVSEEAAPTKELLAPLAESFRKSKHDFGALVKTVLSSNVFFASYRQRIKSPIDFALGTVRALEGRIGTTALAGELEKLGQNVFNPPSVKGWDGGPAWLNGQTLLYRQNLALAFCSTEDARFGARLDPAALARRHGAKSGEEQVDLFLKLFLQGDVPAEQRRKLLDFTKKARTARHPVYWTAQDAADQRVRSLCHLVLTLPEYQLD
ncbi:MAG: DUF1800 domain-containing protein [Gemmataceae bacterium]|nr:DUF1800 domain-containing protein [Gemmataceae bacterium]